MCAITSTRRYGASRKKLVTLIKSLYNLATILGESGLHNCRPTVSLVKFLEGQVSLLYEVPYLERLEGLEEDDEFIYLPGNARFLGDFYKNNVIHLFFIPSLLAVIQLLDLPLNPESTRRFHLLFEEDFQLGKWEEFAQDVESSILALKKGGLLRTLRGSQLKFSKVGASKGFFPAILLAPIETYLWTLWHLRTKYCGQGRNALSREEVLKELYYSYHKAKYLGIISRTEAISKAALDLALRGVEKAELVHFSNSLKNKSSSLKCAREKIDEYLDLLGHAQKSIISWQLERQVTMLY